MSNINYSKYFGVFFPNESWAPAPRYLLRRERILKFFGNKSPGVLIEIGSATGAMLYDLHKLGYVCKGFDISSKSGEFAQKYFSGNKAIAVVSDLNQVTRHNADYLLAMEVLEHIEDDISALKQWHSFLKVGGDIVITVPAHMKRWSEADENVGHFRRYEKSQLISKLNSAGFEDINVECFGWPLSNVMDPIRRRLKKSVDESSSKTELSKKSGVERKIETRLFKFYNNIFGAMAFKILFFLQHITSQSELGTGFIVYAKAR